MHLTDRHRTVELLRGVDDVEACEGEGEAGADLLPGAGRPQPEPAVHRRHANGEMVSALDGNWATVEKAVGEKIRAKSDTAKLDGAKAANGAAVVAASGVSVEQATKDSVRAIMPTRR